MERLVIGLTIYVALALAGIGVWTWRLGQLGRERPSVSRACGFPWWRTSIIVPARNEAENLPALLTSLGKLRPPPHEIIVVDDHSTDETAAVARAHGARVVVPPPLPDGWNGKPWACHRGSIAATGQALLFTDADTVHAPWSLARTVRALRDADLVTVVPSHLAIRFWEKVQGLFHLILLVATRAGADARGGRRFSIGQYLLIRRDAYADIGGHASVRDVIAEDLAIARRADLLGHRVRVVAHPGLVAVRMYPDGLGAFWRGWRRSFRDGIAAAAGSGVAETSLVIAWLLGIPIAAAQAAIDRDATTGIVVAVAWIVSATEIARRQRLIGRLPWWSALLFPVPVAAFALISAAAAIDQARGSPVVWRGRRIMPARWGRR